MAIKQLWTKVSNWFGSFDSRHKTDVAVDDEGLICEQPTDSVNGDMVEPSSSSSSSSADAGGEIVVKKSRQVDRRENIERLNDAFNSLVTQLGGINEHLGKQISQHEELMARIEKLPDLLESLPEAVGSQRQVVDELIGELKSRDLKDRQFAETIEKIPTETSRQTNALIDMGRKISVSTDIDAQLSDSFNKFHETLQKLDDDTVNQANSINQMNKTFTASDRYFKYIISRQNKRFMWIFITAMAVCVFAIIALIAAVLMVTG